MVWHNELPDSDANHLLRFFAVVLERALSSLAHSQHACTIRCVCNTWCEDIVLGYLVQSEGEGQFVGAEACRSDQLCGQWGMRMTWKLDFFELRFLCCKTRRCNIELSLRFRVRNNLHYCAYIWGPLTACLDQHDAETPSATCAVPLQATKCNGVSTK